MTLSSRAAAWLLLTGFAGAAANAGPILWSLPPVALQGCCIPPLGQQHASVSGTFAFDWLTQTYSDWNFNISGYTAPVEHLNGSLTPATSNIISGGPAFLHLNYGGGVSDLTLTFGFPTTFGIVETPLTSFGGRVPVLVGNSSRLVSFFASAPPGSSVSSVPEPVAGALVLVGAALLCVWKPGRFRRGRRKS